jgi:hypothetical protein
VKNTGMASDYFFTDIFVNFIPGVFFLAQNDIPNGSKLIPLRGLKHKIDRRELVFVNLLALVGIPLFWNEHGNQLQPKSRSPYQNQRILTPSPNK